MNRSYLLGQLGLIPAVTQAKFIVDFRKFYRYPGWKVQEK